jgi:hypothetical protein
MFQGWIKKGNKREKKESVEIMKTMYSLSLLFGISFSSSWRIVINFSSPPTLTPASIFIILAYRRKRTLFQSLLLRNSLLQEGEIDKKAIKL